MLDRTIVDEHRLAEFRKTVLSPEHLYESLPGKEAVLLVNVPPGIGKSHAVKGLIPHALSMRHDLVIYVAPTRAIIHEFVLRQDVQDDKLIVLEPRPRSMCGGLNKQWIQLEARSCSALGKDQLCSTCPHSQEQGGACGWPEQMAQINQTTKLIVMTEQYLILNPDLFQQLITKSDSEQTLIVFDEALFMTAINKQVIKLDQIELFKQVLQTATGLPDSVINQINDWVQALEYVIDSEVSLENLERFYPGSINPAMAKVQEYGMRRYAKDFHYIAFDLALLNSPVMASQWRDDATIEIVKKINIRGCEAMVLSGYLDAQIIEERLQCPVTSLVNDTVFVHSQTTFTNIADSVGSAFRMSNPAHLNRIVDLYFALIVRNIKAKKRTVLVCRKKLISNIKDRIEYLAARMDAEINCVCPAVGVNYEANSPNDVALINYGVIGINGLQEYDALYCVGGYYCDVGHLNDVYQQTLPPESRFNISINTAQQSRNVVASDGTFHSRFHARRASATLKLLEPSVVLQAVGRIRPFTTPAEVIMFQCDDYSNELGKIQMFDNLPAARVSMSVPTGKELLRSFRGDCVRHLMCNGMSLRAAADKLGIAPSTAGLARAAPTMDELLNKITVGEEPYA